MEKKEIAANEQAGNEGYKVHIWKNKKNKARVLVKIGIEEFNKRIKKQKHETLKEDPAGIEFAKIKEDIDRHEEDAANYWSWF